MRNTWHAILLLAKNLFLRSELYFLLALTICLYITGFFFPFVFFLAHLLLGLTLVLLCMDIWMLFRVQQGISGGRDCPERFSNGDQNPIAIHVQNFYPFPISVSIVDEIPFQFQIRDHQIDATLEPGERVSLTYQLRPVERGEYEFGRVRVFVKGAIGLCSKRYLMGEAQVIPTYPSFIQMRKYQLMAVSNRLTELGVKPIRNLGHTTEFEQIKEYVRGDDFRTINWKATARSSKLMVNQYADEKAQPVYCLIDKSRIMKMPFDGMRLLDYAINSSLVIANIALYKKDKVGLITFAEKVDSFLLAADKPLQMKSIQELLYKLTTDFKEASMDSLYVQTRRKISHRSLLILFTNFESLEGMKRQLPYLQKLAKSHVLVVVFFENSAVKNLIHKESSHTSDLYIQTIGENFSFEKRQIVRELTQRGIISLLTTPQNLTVDIINSYLEVKSRRLL